jgi:hypothetical protein
MTVMREFACVVPNSEINVAVNTSQEFIPLKGFDLESLLVVKL